MSDTAAVFTKIFSILIVCLLLSLLLIAMKMLAADARRRGKPAVLAVLLVLVSFPPGLLLWLAFRPELWNATDASFNYVAIACNRAVRQCFQNNGWEKLRSLVKE